MGHPWSKFIIDNEMSVIFLNLMDYYNNCIVKAIVSFGKIYELAIIANIKLLFSRFLDFSYYSKCM